MATLTEQQKTFIVQELACYQTYSEVALSVKELFGIEIERQQVYLYDPTKQKKIAKKWKDIFVFARNHFLEVVTEIPIANKAYRLKELNRMYQDEKRKKIQNQFSMRQTIEQAAKESGDYYSSRIKIGANFNIDKELAKLINIQPEELPEE